MIREIDGTLVVMGHVPTAGGELGKALSTAGFQGLGAKLSEVVSGGTTQALVNSPAATNAGNAPTK